ncbi:hypothetical protein [Ramlibacter sp. AN1133]|uniref:hypothetical protein n=1 Tax=Ramlibacter sp. AN1133 TaxID=3133429 RepID=UPI0030C34408
MPMKRPAPSPSHSAARRFVRSEDGAVAFTLSRAPMGIFVERVQFRQGRGRVTHAAIFTDDTSFERWCDADSVRFDYPLVHINLKRHGNNLLRRE